MYLFIFINFTVNTDKIGQKNKINIFPVFFSLMYQMCNI